MEHTGLPPIIQLSNTSTYHCRILPPITIIVEYFRHIIEHYYRMTMRVTHMADNNIPRHWTMISPTVEDDHSFSRS